MLQPLVAERFRDEPRYREGHIRIINPLPGRCILGVHVPEMKTLAKELARRGDARELIRGFAEGGAYALVYEELIVWGLMIDYVRVPWSERSEMLEKFVPAIDNWGVCDTFCSNAKWVSDEPPVSSRKSACVKCTREELWRFLQPYLKSQREFEVRFAIVMSMVHLLDSRWFPKVCAGIDALDFTRIHSDYISVKAARRSGALEAGTGVAPGEPPYYVRMAVAWLLATALAKFPDETRRYVNGSRLPEDVKRLYARKARESFRTRTVSAF